ncbi:hypothetical protein RJT34_02940 [Clitoria ternatea]|uniref:L-ascorbate oxidase n=1 Tax=Clitoria ternatea TaxID=43366 RepID=A0AAN9KJW2_CLITE
MSDFVSHVFVSDKGDVDVNQQWSENMYVSGSEDDNRDEPSPEKYSGSLNMLERLQKDSMTKFWLSVYCKAGNGIKQRKNSWRDGVLGTNCPIPSNFNYTYKFQAEDQIGTYTYFPSTQMHKAAGGFGALNVYHRSVIPIPYPNPDGDFTLLIGDWYKTNHKNLYDSLNVHVGQSVFVLVTLNQPPKDYFVVASTRFSETILTSTPVLDYSNSNSHASGPLPAPPAGKYNDYDWSMKQARTYRWNPTANAAKPNPQGSFHYGKITPTRVFKFANSAPLINGKLRYAVNKVSYVNPDTPLKLADYFNIPRIFDVNLLQNTPSNGAGFIGTSVYPNSWTSILVSLDNQGMWNLRSSIWECTAKSCQ